MDCNSVFLCTVQGCRNTLITRPGRIEKPPDQTPHAHLAGMISLNFQKRLITEEETKAVSSATQSCHRFNLAITTKQGLVSNGHFSP